MKEIGRCYKYIVKAIDGLNTQMMEQMITPEKLTNRFCGNLGLANLEFLKLATAVIATFRSLRITEGHTSEKQPASVAAAAIYLCVQIWRGEAAVGIDVKRISVSLVSFVHHASHLPRHLPAVIYLYRGPLGIEPSTFSLTKTHFKFAGNLWDGGGDHLDVLRRHVPVRGEDAAGGLRGEDTGTGGEFLFIEFISVPVWEVFFYHAYAFLEDVSMTRVFCLQAPKMDKGDAAALEAGLAGLIGGAEDGGGGALSLPPL